MTTKFIALALITLTVTGCSMMGLGGDVFPPHPDWAKDAWERQEQAGSN